LKKLIKIQRAFPTGIKDLDILFLSRLNDDRDLLNALNINAATKKYTNNEFIQRANHILSFQYTKDLFSTYFGDPYEDEDYGHGTVITEKGDNVLFGKKHL